MRHYPQIMWGEQLKQRGIRNTTFIYIYIVIRLLLQGYDIYTELANVIIVCLCMSPVWIDGNAPNASYTHEFQNVADAHFTMDFNYFSVMVYQIVSVHTRIRWIWWSLPLTLVQSFYKWWISANIYTPSLLNWYFYYVI